MTDFTKYVKANAVEGVRVEITDARSDDGVRAYCPECGKPCRVPLVAIDEPVVSVCGYCGNEFTVAPPAYKPPERDAWVMLIARATEQECRELGKMAGSIGLTGKFVRGDIARAFYKESRGINEKGADK